LRVDLGPAPEMPSLMIRQVPHAHINNAYWNPPQRYPDGRVLFKFGCEVENPPRAENAADIAKWFATGGDQAEAAALLETAQAMLPAARIRSYDRVPCVITRTDSGYPIIGWVDQRIAVAVGGNGSSAKSSDELGRLASTLFSDEGWNDTELSADLFAPPG
jgi:sarcosine oxidase